MIHLVQIIFCFIFEGGEKMNNSNQKRSLTRRDALKTLLAIGGAVTLSHVPNKWDTPVVEVGNLPAFAQCTPPNCPTACLIELSDLVLVNDRGVVTDQFLINDQSCIDATGGLNPTAAIYRTSYSDTCGRMSSAAILRYRSKFLDANGQTYPNWPSTDVPITSSEGLQVSGDSYSGSLTFARCLNFGPVEAVALQVTVDVTVQNSDGSYVTNETSFTRLFDRPAGAKIQAKPGDALRQ